MADGRVCGHRSDVLPEVGLVDLDGDTPVVAALRAAVMRHRLGPGQHRFVQSPVSTLPRADADPNRTPFAVVHEGAAVGFGIIDRDGQLREIATDPVHSVLLRAFYIAPRWQGRGLGRAACVAVPALVTAIVPHARAVLLTVNEANPAAYRTYTAAGFVDTGRRYLGGDAGPQHVLLHTIGG
ncbi:GNAT family N-acetyltransferase [Nocardiopsis ansamitocini]|nr:GNAT family N-acetyltransferase [Nocardiopsis ansamitocini]